VKISAYNGLFALYGGRRLLWVGWQSSAETDHWEFVGPTTYQLWFVQPVAESDQNQRGAGQKKKKRLADKSTMHANFVVLTSFYHFL
jgi:hypothetical protein